MRLLSSLLILLSLIFLSEPLLSQTAESDSLFSIGVELYNKGKYKEAIPVFEQVWQIDSVTLPETSTRRSYGEDWLAAALFKKGDKERAMKTSKLSYNLEPVDRRLTVEADSILEEASTEFRNGMGFLAELKINRSLEALKSTFGTDHPAYLAGLYNLVDFYLITQDVPKALRYAEEIEELIKVLKPEPTFFMGAVNTVRALDVFLNQMKKDNPSKTYPPEHYATAYATAIELGEKAREQLKGYMECNGYMHSVLMDLLGGVYLRMNRDDIYSTILSEAAVEWDTLPKEKKVNSSNALEGIIMGMLQLRDIDFDKTESLIDEDLSIIDHYSSLHPDEPYPYEAKARMLKQRALVNHYKNDPEGTAKYAKETFDILNENPEISPDDYSDLMAIYGNALYSLKRNAESEDWIDRAISVLERKGDDGAYHLIGAYMTKTDMISTNGDKRAALEYAKNKFSKIEKYSSTFPDVAAFALKICGFLSFFSDKSDIEESKKWLNKTIGIFRSFGDDCIATPNYFKTQWASSFFNSEPSTLNEVYEELDEIIRRNPSNPSIGMMKGWLADIHAQEQIRAGNTEEALKYNSQAIAFFSDSGNQVPVELYQTQQEIYAHLGDKRNSLAVVKKRVETLEEVSGERSLEYVMALHELAGNYGMNLQLEDALRTHEKEKSILMESWDKFSKLEVTSHLLDVVEGFYTFAKYEEADKLLNDILASYPDLKKNKELYLWWRIDKTCNLTALNRFEEAVEMAQDLENDVARNKYNSNYSMLGLVRAAYTYYSAGDFPKAKDTFDKAYPYFKSLETDDAIIRVFREMGTYGQLLEMCGEKEKSVEISSIYTARLGNSVLFDEEHSELLKIPEMAYNAYLDNGVPGIVDFFEGEIDDFTQKFGATAMLTQHVLQSYLQILIAAGEATDAYTKGMEIYSFLSKEGAVMILPPLKMVIASAANKAGDFDYALNLLDEISQSKSTANVTEEFQLLAAYGDCYLGNRDYQKALSSFRDAFTMSRDFVLNNFLTMSNQERTSLWNIILPFYKNTLPQAARTANDVPEFDALAYDAALFSNSLLLSSDQTVEAAVNQTKNRKINKLYDDFKRSKSLYERAKNNNSELADRESREYKNALEKLRKEAHDSERNLLLALKERTGQYNRQLTVDWKQVKNALKPGEAAMELLDIVFSDSLAVGVGVLLRHDSETPVLRDLVYQYNHSSPYENAAENEKLADKIWGSWGNLLDGVHTIWFAPQGRLAVTPLESLPGIDKIGDGQPINFRRLTSTRQLALDRSKAKGNGTVIYGGINYDTPQETLAADAMNYPEVKPTRSLTDFSFMQEKDAQGREFIKKAPLLPGTEEEAIYLSSLLKDSLNRSSRLLLADKGTETSVKALSGRAPALLHIGTHGFYFDETQSKVLSYFQRTSNADKSPEEIAMERSGLLFAGANPSLYGNGGNNTGVDDGVLSAAEIASLNLEGLDLIVLSACETALGKVSADGVFGLQRGFKKAGAESLLMSLWKVDDAATSFLMKEFYQNWLLKGDSKQKALDKAKKAVKERPEWNSPQYWAAFILLDAMD